MAARASKAPSTHWQRTAIIWLNASFVPLGDHAGSEAKGPVTFFAPVPLGNAVATPPGSAEIVYANVPLSAGVGGGGLGGGGLGGGGVGGGGLGGGGLGGGGLGGGGLGGG